jgi:hypothetical protein
LVSDHIANRVNDVLANVSVKVNDVVTLMSYCLLVPFYSAAMRRFKKRVLGQGPSYMIVVFCAGTVKH